MIQASSRRAVLFACIVVSLLATSLRAATEPAQVDQSFLAGPYGTNHSLTTYAISAAQTWGQSFTVGRTGWLTQIDLQLSRNSAVTAPVTFEIRRMSGAVPDSSAGGLLFIATIPATDVPFVGAFNYAQTFTTTLSLLDDEIPVTLGDTLAVIGSTSTVSPNTYNWSGQPTNPYAGGTSLWKPGGNPYSAQPTTDTGFQTWVALPEPAIGLLAFVLPLALRRRRC